MNFKIYYKSHKILIIFQSRKKVYKIKIYFLIYKKSSTSLERIYFPRDNFVETGGITISVYIHLPRLYQYSSIHPSRYRRIFKGK